MNVTEYRKKLCNKYLTGPILEIGPLDTPTFTKTETEIYYLDAFSDEHLAQAHGGHRLRQNVGLDYVCADINYYDVVKRQFSLVIANHVVEHIPDLIRWFTAIEKILAPHGVLFLSIPDKRYTFDYHRNLTTVVDLLFNYDHQIKKATFHQILDHLLHTDPTIKAKAIWDGQKPEPRHYRMPVRKAFDAAKREVLKGTASPHCHVFTQDTFIELIGALRELSLLNLRLVDSHPPRKPGNEFHLVLGS